MRLLLDIERSVDGRVEGIVHPGGVRAAMPFSGLLELLGTVEELLSADQGAPGAEEAPAANKVPPAAKASPDCLSP